MKKRILGVALAGALAFSAIAGSIATVSAADAAPPDPYRLPEYTPSAGVETRKVMFAMPGSWTGEEGSTTRETWEKYGSSAGLYWWGGEDNPDEAGSHGWPGWKMKKEDSNIPNLYSTLASRKAPNMIFSNFIDGGMDPSYPEYSTSQQTEDLQVEWFGEVTLTTIPRSSGIISIIIMKRISSMILTIRLKNSAITLRTSSMMMWTVVFISTLTTWFS